MNKLEQPLLQAQAVLIEILQNKNEELRKRIEHLENILFQLAKDGHDNLQGTDKRHTDK